jgi:DNA anti-recombination protein RmuC
VASKDFVEEGGLYDYARSQNVFLVSPLTFWAYLTAIAHGLHGLEIERRAEEILARLHTLSAHSQDFSTD